MIAEPVAVAAGGALGALSRYAVGLLSQYCFGPFFPIGTLSVNVAGSFIIGFFSIFFVSRVAAGSALNLFTMVGFLGAFTTFSSFSLETLHLTVSGHVGYALLNVGLNLLLCLMAVSLGVMVGHYYQ